MNNFVNRIFSEKKTSILTLKPNIVNSRCGVDSNPVNVCSKS